MERLIISALEELSSYDASTVRKGIRHIEGLLGQLCLKAGHAIPSDDAFHAFLRLQDDFRYNMCTRLIPLLERKVYGSMDADDKIIASCLNLLGGILLLHRSSRDLFSQQYNMRALLVLLDHNNPSTIQMPTLHVIVCALVDSPVNMRVFEFLDGLATVTSLFKHSKTAHAVKIQLLEFMYFYLMPEGKPLSEAWLSNKGLGLESGTRVKSTQEKSIMLGEFLPNVNFMVRDLEESDFQPFG